MLRYSEIFVARAGIVSACAHLFHPTDLLRCLRTSSFALKIQEKRKCEKLVKENARLAWPIIGYLSFIYGGRLKNMIKRRGTEAASKILDMIQPLRDVVYISIDYMVTSTTKCVCNVSLSANTRIA